MKLAEKHPHPGDAPPKPGAEPELDYKDRTCLERREAWRVAARTHNEHLAKLRQFYVASALDELMPDGKKMSDLAPVERIAVVVGCAFLDGVGLPESGLFGELFGGLNL